MENTTREWWDKPPTTPAYSCEKCGGENSTPHNYAWCPSCRREAEAKHMVKVFGVKPTTPKSYRRQCARCGTTITAFDAHTHCDPCAKEINKTMEKLENPSDSDAALAAQLGIVYPPQLARALGVSESTLQLWRQNGNGPPFVKMGKYVLYRVRDVHEWLDKNITDRVRERTTTEVPPVHYKQQSVYSKINPLVKTDETHTHYPHLLEGSTDGTD